MRDILPYPSITAKEPEKQIAQINSYLIQLKEALEFAFMGVSNDSLSAINAITANMNSDKNEQEDQFQQAVQEVKSKVSKGSVSSEISQEADKITIIGDRFILKATNIEIDEKGNVTINGVLSAGKGSKIGGFESNDTTLFAGGQSGEPYVFVSTGAVEDTIAGYASDGWCFGAGNRFGVTNEGYLACEDALIDGWKFEGGLITSPIGINGEYVSLGIFGVDFAYLNEDGDLETGSVKWEQLAKLV